jgi:hypothetical protein
MCGRIIIANEPNEIEKENLNSILKTRYDIKIIYVKLEILYASWNLKKISAA